MALTAGHQHCWVDEAGWGLPQALSSWLPCHNTRTPAAAQSPSLQIRYATATQTHFVNTQTPPKRTTPKPPHPLHGTSVTTQVKKLKSSLTGQFNLTSNTRLFNLRTCKGMPNHLGLQHRQVTVAQFPS